MRACGVSCSGRSLLSGLVPALACLASLSPSSFGSSAADAQEPQRQGADARPSILLILTDDQSWLHMGAYGCPGVETPGFDAVARRGALFTNAYVAAPSCTPSRSALLTGQAIWRLEEGGQFGKTLPRKFPVFTSLLEESGYFVGWTGKGWGPGNLEEGGWGEVNPCGRPFNDRLVHPKQFGRDFFSLDYTKDFREFLDAKPRGAPFFFWCGTVQPHRPYDPGSGLKSGKRLEDATIPPPLPDIPALRQDFLDYYLQIDYLDTHVRSMVAVLKERRLLDNTIVVVTSDNGIGVPNAKSTLYDLGTRVPFAVSWPAGMPGGRTVDDFVSLADLAPTFLEAASLEVPDQMTGRSFLDVLRSAESGRVDPARDHVFLALENNNPMRAIRTDEYLFVWNLKPGRRGTAGYLYPYEHEPGVREAIDFIRRVRTDEELYDLDDDPWQVHDVAGDERYAAKRDELRERLREHLADTGDPRLRGEDPFGVMGKEGRDGGAFLRSMFGKADLREHLDPEQGQRGVDASRRRRRGK